VYREGRGLVLTLRHEGVGDRVPVAHRRRICKTDLGRS